MDKLKNYISAYLFSFIGYCMCIGFLISMLLVSIKSSDGFIENMILSLALPVILFSVIILAVSICFIIEFIAHKYFNYKSSIKNFEPGFFFKLGILFGLLPFVVLFSYTIISTVFIHIDLIRCKHIYEKIILIITLLYPTYLVTKFIFKKDKN